MLEYWREGSAQRQRTEIISVHFNARGVEIVAGDKPLVVIDPGIVNQ